MPAPLPDPASPASADVLAERAACVLVAAGDSQRMGGLAALGARKPLVLLSGRPVIEHTLAALDASERIAEVVIVAHQDDVRTLERWCADRPAFAKVVAVVPGGPSRADSVRLGVFWTSFDVGVIAVHDAARPLVAPDRVDEVVARAASGGAALLAVPVADTLKRSDDGEHAAETLDRAQLFAAHTPQCFHARRFRELCQRAERDGFHPTDDAALWERYVGPVALVESARTNLKITTREDLELAQALLERRAAARAEEPA